MKRIITAAVLIAIVLLLIYKSPWWLFLAVCTLLAYLSLDEYFKIVQSIHQTSFRTLTYILLPLLYALCSRAYNDGNDAGGRYIVPGLICVPIVFIGFLYLILALRSENCTQSFSAAAMSWMAWPYIILPFTCLVALQASRHAAFTITYLFISVWSGDIFAFYAGKAWGKSKLAPHISPGKTWVGTMASTLSSMILGTCWFFIAPKLIFSSEIYGYETTIFNFNNIKNIWICLALTFFINVTAQIGDLVESMMKRAAGIKDSGTLLPGHGGILDRIDALLFATPAFFVCINVFDLYDLGQ